MTMPVRGFGQKYVDFCGSRSPRSTTLPDTVRRRRRQQVRGDRLTAPRRRSPPRSGSGVYRSPSDDTRASSSSSWSARTAGGSPRQITQRQFRVGLRPWRRTIPTRRSSSERVASDRVQIAARRSRLGGIPGELHTVERPDRQAFGPGVHDERQQAIPRPRTGDGAHLVAVGECGRVPMVSVRDQEVLLGEPIADRNVRGDRPATMNHTLLVRELGIGGSRRHSIEEVLQGRTWPADRPEYR